MSKLLELPIELHAEILQYLDWSEHFATAAACPIWASVLQTDTFRRKRYCVDFWKDSKGGDVNATVRDNFTPNVFAHSLVQRERSEAGYGGKPLYVPGWRRGHGLHQLLGNKAVLAVKQSGETRLLIGKANQTLQPGMRNSNDGDREDIRRLKSAYLKLWGRFSCYDLTDSPLLESDSQFFPDDERSPCAVLESESDLEGDADCEVSIWKSYYLTDGKTMREVAIPESHGHSSWRYLPGFRSVPETSLKGVFKKIGSGIHEDILSKDDKALECWVVFRAPPIGFSVFSVSTDDKLNPQRQIFMYVLISKETEDLPECGCMRSKLPCPMCGAGLSRP
ncbi:hypothetical protein TWF730_003747 [Orbilia blumenaviensis]|uniref:F-box domain-containing protein n=1 Tax=Orbilia blumenaviensis TaxID=1796055 RepID=A0AAV9U5P3_9PEZI